MRHIFIILLTTIWSVSHAAEKVSDPFFYAIVAKACVASKCQNISTAGETQIALFEDSKKPGTLSGQFKLDYNIENIDFVSAIHVSEFEFNNARQTNFYLETTQRGSAEDHGSAEVIVDSIPKLNLVAQYSTPFVKGDIRIELAIIIGPTAHSVQSKVQSLVR
jgi:hypothetical protein